MKGKKAAGLWKPFQKQRADETTLRSTIARNGITGLAVVLGSVSGGLACRDFDDQSAYLLSDEYERLLPDLRRERRDPR